MPRKRYTPPTYFFPVGNDIKEIVENWVNHLRNKLIWGDNDPLFTATNIRVAENKLS